MKCRNMKQISIVLLAIIFYIANIEAQEIDLNKMTETARKEYLLKIAKEVTQNFGPGWYRDSVIPSISDLMVFDERPMSETPQLDLSKNIGRKYYIVTFDYDEKTRRKYVWSYASKVRIWADNGEPLAITFGNTYGVHFLGKSYKQWLLSGIEGDEKNYFDELTKEELEKQIQPMYEMVKKSRENIK